jgi:hypothetical protein
MVSGFSLFWVGITQKGFQKGWNGSSNPFSFLDWNYYLFKVSVSNFINCLKFQSVLSFIRELFNPSNSK